MDDQESARWREWTNILGRVRFGKQKVNGKTVSATTIKAVGMRLSVYGNPDGTRVRPGIARIAVDLESTHTTVRNCVTVLERVGLLRLVHPGTRVRAAEYRLAIGAELMEVVDVWSPARHSLEIERVSEAYRGRAEGPENADPSGVGDEPETLTPEGSAIDPENGPDDHRNADPSGTENPETLTPQGPETLTPQGSATSHGPRVGTDQPESEDPVADVTESRARDRPNPILRRQYGHRAGDDCPEHPGLDAGTRPEDGVPRCPICRAKAAPRPADIRDAQIRAALKAREEAA